jgi:predicted nucleic acid-binding protein
MKSIRVFKPKIFIDTNVLVDYLIPSAERHGQAADVFSLILTSTVEAAISTQSILDAAYIGRRCPGFSQKDFREIVTTLQDRTNTDSISTFNLREALQDEHPDLEDNAQIAFAYDQCCDVLLTNDRELLAREAPSPMKIMTPEEFLSHCRACV